MTRTASYQLFVCLFVLFTVVDCGPLPAPQNGDIDFDLTTFGSTATYSCNPGFDLQGSTSRTCQVDGWSGSEPSCICEFATASESHLDLKKPPNVLLQSHPQTHCALCSPTQPTEMSSSPEPPQAVEPRTTVIRDMSLLAETVLDYVKTLVPGLEALQLVNVCNLYKTNN